MSSKAYKVKEEVINSLLQYLAGKPFSEVNGLINQLMSSEELAESTPEPKEPALKSTRK